MLLLLDLAKIIFQEPWSHSLEMDFIEESGVDPFIHMKFYSLNSL